MIEQQVIAEMPVLTTSQSLSLPMSASLTCLLNFYEL